jgi:hypothetical protein
VTHADDRLHDDAEHAPGPADGDALEHLWNAAHEMLSAMRMVLDAADEFVASQRGPRAGSPRGPGGDARSGRVRHIDIDLDLDAEGRPASGSGSERP